MGQHATIAEALHRRSAHGCAHAATPSPESDAPQLRMVGLGGYGSGGRVWPIASGPAVGFSISAGTASRTAATKGIAITAPQKASQPVGTTPFSSPAQPSHLPDMGMSPDIGISCAAVMADFV